MSLRRQGRWVLPLFLKDHTVARHQLALKCAIPFYFFNWRLQKSCRQSSFRYTIPPLSNRNRSKVSLRTRNHRQKALSALCREIRGREADRGRRCFSPTPFPTGGICDALPISLFAFPAAC